MIQVRGTSIFLPRNLLKGHGATPEQIAEREGLNIQAIAVMLSEETLLASALSDAVAWAIVLDAFAKLRYKKLLEHLEDLGKWAERGGFQAGPFLLAPGKADYKPGRCLAPQLSKGACIENNVDSPRRPESHSGPLWGFQLCNDRPCLRTRNRCTAQPSTGCGSTSRDGPLHGAGSKGHGKAPTYLGPLGVAQPKRRQ